MINYEKCNSCLFVYFNNVKEILENKNYTDEYLTINDIKEIVFVCHPNYKMENNISIDEINSIVSYIKSLKAMSFIVFGKAFDTDILSLILACDIRICYKDAEISFKDYGMDFIGLDKKLSFIMGRKFYLNKNKILQNTLNAQDLKDLNFVNIVLKDNNFKEEITEYIKSLLAKKTDTHIKMILDNHKSFIDMDMNLDNNFLAQKEAENFCLLCNKYS